MKIYLAGPLFSTAERAFLDTVAARLRSEGFDVFVPHEQFAEQKFMRSDGGSAADEVYAVDLAGVTGADAVLAWLDGTQVETVKVDGRRFDVRVGQTDTPNQWRMVITRATMVIDPDPELEMQRAREVAQRFMERTCKGGPYEEILAGLQGGINYRTLFRCT